MDISGFDKEIMIEKNYTRQFNQTHHKILDLLWSDQDLQLYDNQSTTFMSTIFTVIAGFILVFGAIVHRAIFKLLNRLPDRPINTLIYPTLVSDVVHHTRRKKNFRDKSTWRELNQGPPKTYYYCMATFTLNCNLSHSNLSFIC